MYKNNHAPPAVVGFLLLLFLCFCWVCVCVFVFTVKYLSLSLVLESQGASQMCRRRGLGVGGGKRMLDVHWNPSGSSVRSVQIMLHLSSITPLNQGKTVILVFAL